MAPSIIFLDELDGLVPARSANSSSGDQVFASVVSTLLALMDGVVDRGAVVIIGATNRWFLCYCTTPKVLYIRVLLQWLICPRCMCISLAAHARPMWPSMGPAVGRFPLHWIYACHMFGNLTVQTRSAWPMRKDDIYS